MKNCLGIEIGHYRVKIAYMEHGELQTYVSERLETENQTDILSRLLRLSQSRLVCCPFPRTAGAKSRQQCDLLRRNAALQERSVRTAPG